MQVKKVFFDANIFNDIFDNKRATYNISKEALSKALKAKMKLYTSCDIATNIYYITAKYTTKENALNAIDAIKKMVTIIPFSEIELSATIRLMREDNDYKDFEDAIQYTLALQTKCDVIVSNDKKFIAKKIDCMISEELVKRFFHL